MSNLFTPYKLGPVTLRTRTIRSAAFESMGKDFGPTEQPGQALQSGAGPLSRIGL